MEKLPQNNSEKVVVFDEYRKRKEKKSPESILKPGQKARVFTFEKLQDRQERKEREELIKELGLPKNATDDEINRAMAGEIDEAE